jgi:hypothetical protein
MPGDAEKGNRQDELDAHVEDLLTKRAKLKRTFQGLWAFLKTPIGIVTGISTLNARGNFLTISQLYTDFWWRSGALLSYSSLRNG